MLMIRSLNITILSIFLTAHTILLTSTSSNAIASEICADLRALTALPRAEIEDDLHSFSFRISPEFTANPARCSQSKGQSGKSVRVCVWTFDYRSIRATEGFEALNRSLLQCLGPEVRIRSDQPVNHPDTYDLRTYVYGDASLSVSMKDKAALDKTYVFLRIGE